MGEVQKRRRSSVSLDAVKPYRLNGTTTAGSLHEHLRRLILDGAIPNGASIAQVELAERLGVSRTPLRSTWETSTPYTDVAFCSKRPACSSLCRCWTARRSPT